MSWNSVDYSFKKQLNKRVTSAIKQPYEEFGDLGIDINASEVKFQPIPYDNPAQAVTNGVAELRSFFVLTADNSVAGNQAWFAQSGPNRLENWLSDKYGQNYTVHLYDNANNEIFPTDPVGWIFDYVTGVLLFNGNTAGFSQPFKITGYRYIGTYLSNAVFGGGGYNTIQFNAVAMPQRSVINFTGAVTVTDDSINGVTIVAVATPNAPNVGYTPTTPPNWSFAPSVPANVQAALDDISAYLALTAPPPAPLLTGATLTFAGQTQYTAKIPLGLPASWYTLVPAGSTINNLVYNGSFNLSALGWRAGTANTPSTYGIITANVNGVDISTYNMSGGAGSSGIIQALNLGVFNTIWEKADGKINANQVTEGVASYIMKHTVAGNSNPYPVYLDNSAIAVTFSTPLGMTVNSLVNKYLSGVAYLGQGTVLNLTFSANNLYQKAYVPSGATIFDLVGTPGASYDPASTPNYTDVLTVTTTITLSVANVADLAPIATVIARKPNNPNAAQSTFNLLTISNGISTFGIVSSTTTEAFQDEAQRLNSGSLTAFVSSAALAPSEAKVVPGALTWQVGGNAQQLFTRRYSKAAASNAILSLVGTAVISARGSGMVNAYVKLETDNLWFDLGLPFGAINGTGDGSSQANSIGAKVSVSGGNYTFSFGTYSTAGNGNQFLFQIVLLNSSFGTITGLDIS